MSVETEFLYSLPTSTTEAGLSHEGREQVRLIIEAVQTKRRDITWPARVWVKWTTIDLALASQDHKDEVAILLSFVDDVDPSRPEILKLEFRFPKKGISGFSTEKYLSSVLKA